MNNFISKETNQQIYYMTEDTYRRVEEKYKWDRTRLKWHKIIWKILTDSEFRFGLKASMLLDGNMRSEEVIR